MTMKGDCYSEEKKKRSKCLQSANLTIQNMQILGEAPFSKQLS